MGIIADDVVGLFFPLLANLGLRVEATVSPKVERKMVYAGANTSSFQSASNDLKHLAEIEIKSERVRRATVRNGNARCELARLLSEAFTAKSIPEQRRGPTGKTPPKLAVVMSDGGRYQRLDRSAASSSDSDSFWKESRVGILLSMGSQAHKNDPTPDLPDFLQDVSIAKKLALIGKVAGENSSEPAGEAPEEPPWQSPELLCKDVVASGKSWKEFGPLLASTAWYANFYQAEHRVFVSDGSTAIEDMQGRWFANFTSVLDLMHALSYCLAAARAMHTDTQDSWETYIHFAAAIWKGRIEDVISKLESYLQSESHSVAESDVEDTASKDSAEIVRQAAVYYRNHSKRMNYPLYRQKGYPLTSSLMESTVKQINQRVKGSEKFWSTQGGEALLRLRADYLSESKPMDEYWKITTQNANGCRAYTQAT